MPQRGGFWGLVSTFWRRTSSPWKAAGPGGAQREEESGVAETQAKVPRPCDVTQPRAAGQGRAGFRPPLCLGAQAASASGSEQKAQLRVWSCKTQVSSEDPGRTTKHQRDP